MKVSREFFKMLFLWLETKAQVSNAHTFYCLNIHLEDCLKNFVHIENEFKVEAENALVQLIVLHPLERVAVVCD